MIRKIELDSGVKGFAENKDYASQIRREILIPALDRGEEVVIDFAAVRYATQSFIHALIGEALNKYQESFLDKVEFKNCSPQLQSVIELVVDYSLGGFPTVKSA
ncbi:MAG: STAS-like domain-containing protein [Blastocatellia bacterium]